MKKLYLLSIAILLSDAAVAQTMDAARTLGFVPDGAHNMVTGKITFGCGDGPSFAPNVKLRIEGGSGNTATFSNLSGDFSLYTAPAMGVTVVPELETGYFTFSPANHTFAAAPAGSVLAADFCLIPNGIHTDVQIDIVPLDQARPGSDAHYKLIYSNKGTQAISGRITLAYHAQGLNMLAAAPVAVPALPGIANWDFNALAPFESREISVTMNIGSASDTNEPLSLTAQIHTNSPDETPQDNIKSLQQPIVYAVVPNEKLVTQGEYITSGQLDEFLNYTIRFQNTGNYTVQNVVINDFVEPTLDVATLQTTTASHPYRATLKNDKLEIFFENINLPPASENESASHGFATFKIKPKTSVSIGDVIQNTAEIYFDFNAPIVTNTVTTTVMETLWRTPFKGVLFSIYPNPTAGLLHIESQTPIEFVAIFNPLGQNVLNTSHTVIDTTGWASGLYTIKAGTSEKMTVQKFLKL